MKKISIEIFIRLVSPTCTDQIQNQDETDIDCGGTKCFNRCSITRKCSINSDCNNAICVNGICLGRIQSIDLER